MQLIHCDTVSLAYEGKTVVENLSFEVRDGDYLCIVGENGSGKSTLMRALLGLKKPSSGKIHFRNGIRHADVGYMPQQTAVTADFPATVWEVVRSGLRVGGLRPFLNAAERKRLQYTLQLLGIEHIANRAYRELSGGQQQRVLLARALCATEKLLLLDEPVTGLDPSITAELYEQIQTLHQDGITVVMISHDISAAVKYATHILHLQADGAFFGTTEQYLQSDAARRFLEGGQA